MTSGLQFAIVYVFSRVGIMVCLPVLLALFAAVFLLGSTREQRFANMITGFVFAVVAILRVALGFDPKPNSFADQNFGWIIVAIAPRGAGLGVGTAVLYRRIFHEKARVDRDLISDAFS